MSSTFPLGLIHQTLQEIRNGQKTPTKVREVLAVMETLFQDKFIEAYFYDIYHVLKKVLAKTPDDIERIENLLNALLKRQIYFSNWNLEANETIKAIRSGELQVDDIRPFVRDTVLHYEEFYQSQNERIAIRLKNELDSDRTITEKRAYRPLQILGGKDIRHWFRKKGAVNTVETLAQLFSLVPDSVITKKWLDVGCAVGDILNAVNTDLPSLEGWEFYGCDLQSNRIRVANLRAPKKRKYFNENALSLLANGSQLSHVGVVSMFEFIEHLEDPFQMIKELSSQAPACIVVGTPFKQKMIAPMQCSPDPVHLWGFSRTAIETMMKACGLEILASSVARVGEYASGLDWLTVVAIKPELKSCLQDLYRY